jgi:hypothetical protein
MRQDVHFDGIDRDQEQRLRSRKNIQGVSATEKWKSVYTIVFPEVDESAIPSPFAEPPLAVNEIPKMPPGQGNSRSGSLSSIPVDFEKPTDDQNQDPSRARSNTQTSLHPSSAEGRRGHGSRDSRSEEMGRFALTPLQTDVHRTTTEWVLNVSPVSFSETPLSGSGILQSNQYATRKYTVPSDSGISGADSRSPNDGMSETSEDLEIQRLQVETDELRREAGTYHALLLHHQKAWAEEKSSFEKKVRELEAAVNSLKIENKTQPMELSPPDRDISPKNEGQKNTQENVDDQKVQETLESAAPKLKTEEALTGVGAQLTQTPAQLHAAERVQELNQHPIHEPMPNFFLEDEDSSESESETELVGEEKWLTQIGHHYGKGAFQGLLQMATLDSSGSQDNGPSRPSGNSGGGQGANLSSGNGRSGNSKRGRDGGDDRTGSNGRDDKDENNDNVVPEAKRPKSNNGQKLACIFYQRAPHEHQRGACTGPGYPNINRLK